MKNKMVFVSYSRDDLEKVLELSHDLKDRGARLWIDKEDIEPGEPWDDSIDAALHECTHVLAVLSPTSVKSSNVKDEWSAAIDRDKQLVPVMIEKCNLPLRMARMQYIDLTTSKDHAMQDILEALDSETVPLNPTKDASENQATSTEPKPAGKKTDSSGMPLWLRWTLPLASIAILVGALIYKQSLGSLVTIPKVADTTFHLATKKLEALGLKVETVHQENQAVPGKVFATDPEPGDQVAKGSNITLYVSEQPATMPDVIGMNLNQATLALGQSDLVAGESVASLTNLREVGLVFNSVPAAGENIYQASKITLHVSGESGQVPDIVTLTTEEALEELKTLSLTAIIAKAYDPEQINVVLSSEPLAGEPINRNGNVELSIGAPGGWAWMNNGQFISGDVGEKARIRRTVTLRTQPESSDNNSLGTVRSRDSYTIAKISGGWALLVED